MITKAKPMSNNDIPQRTLDLPSPSFAQKKQLILSYPIEDFDPTILNLSVPEARDTKRTNHFSNSSLLGI